MHIRQSLFFGILFIGFLNFLPLKADKVKNFIQDVAGEVALRARQAEILHDIKSISPLINEIILIPTCAVIGGIVGFTFSKKASRGVVGGVLLGSLTGIGVSVLYGDSLINKLAFFLAKLSRA